MKAKINPHTKKLRLKQCINLPHYGAGVKIFSALLLITALIFISGCGCKKTDPHQYDLKLEVWGFFDDRDNLSDIISNYRNINPNVSDIEYKKLTYDTYEKEVLEALASGQGPDIFLIQNTELPGFVDKISPAPAEILNEKKFRSDFVDVVVTDFLYQNQVAAVPLSVDSLGLYYNKDLFNQAGLTAPPKDWNEFTEDVKKLTKFNSSGEIAQAGTSLGTAYNINRSTDVLSMLMLQNGISMTDSTGRVSFDSPSGEDSLNFYTQFAKRGSAFYTWNPRLHYSTDAFSEGTLAMMFNYSWHVNTVKSKAPKLNFAVAPIPQFTDKPPANYASYWGYAVAKNKIPDVPVSGGVQSAPTVSNETRILEAWKFLAYLTTKPESNIEVTASVGGTTQVVSSNFDPAADYISKTGMPSARRDIIETQKNDSWVGVFALGNLIAKSWRQVDPRSTEAIMAEMIDQVNRGQETIHDAISVAVRRINQLQNL